MWIIVVGRELTQWDKYLSANTKSSAVAFSKYGTTSVKTAASAKALYRVEEASAKAVAIAVTKVRTIFELRGNTDKFVLGLQRWFC